MEICLIKYYCVLVLEKNSWTCFVLPKSFFKNQSDMKTKTVLILLSLILIITSSLCKNQAHAEKKLGHHSEIKGQSACRNEYKRYCLNGGECYHLVEEELVG